MRKTILFSIVLLITISTLSQGETQLLATTLTNGTPDFNCISSYTNTSCSVGANLYNLGTLPASGIMANDVWFSFEAPAEKVKLRVCNPSFDAMMEVRDSDANLLFTIDNVPLAGAAGKEVECIDGLTVGEVYSVGIGRASSSGDGTFYFNIEHNAIRVNPFVTGSGPSGCFQVGDVITRTLPCTGTSASVHWKFVDESDNETIIQNNSTSLSLTSVGLCMGMTYTVYCEARAIDAECGNTWYGYSQGTEIEFCETADPVILFPAPSAAIVFDNTTFEAQDMGAGYIYQWRFTTFAGTVDFISNWSNSPVFDPSGLPIYDNYRYNIYYTVYLRAKSCTAEPDPDWNTSMAVFASPLPYINVDDEIPCTYQEPDATFGFYTTTEDYDEYRFLFRNVAAPSSGNSFACAYGPPIGPGINSDWDPNLVIDLDAFSSLTPGNMYMVQVQGRLLESECVACIGTETTIISQQQDWGPVAMIIVRTSGSPPSGDPLPCATGVCVP